MAEKEFTFEQAMARLDEVVKTLERGDVPLEQSLKLFEEGTALAVKCNSMLDEAERQVVKLSKGEDGKPVEQDFLPEV